MFSSPGHAVLAAGLIGLMALAAALPPPAAAQSQPPPDAAPVEAPAQSQPTPQPAKIIDFIMRKYPLGESSDAREAPAATATILGRVREGVEVKVIGIVEGGDWLKVELPDQRAAYVPITAIPAAVPAPVAPKATEATPSPAPPAPAPIAATATPPGDPDEIAAAELPKTVEFESARQEFRAQKKTAVFIAPNSAAPQMYALEAGRTIEALATSVDGKWAWAMTEDGQPAYIALADLALVESATEDANEVVSGRATVKTTGTVVIDGQQLTLFGIVGLGGDYAKQLQSLIDVKGKKLNCHSRDGKYTCFLPGEVDIALAALRNGAARPAEDAPADYQQQADAAKADKLGVWGKK